MGFFQFIISRNNNNISNGIVGERNHNTNREKQMSKNAKQMKVLNNYLTHFRENTHSTLEKMIVILCKHRIIIDFEIQLLPGFHFVCLKSIVSFNSGTDYDRWIHWRGIQKSHRHTDDEIFLSFFSWWSQSSIELLVGSVTMGQTNAHADKKILNEKTWSSGRDGGVVE